MSEEIRLQREKLKGQSPAHKWGYYWSHYRLAISVLFLGALIVSSIIHALFLSTQTLLSVVYINAFPNVEDEEFMAGFNAYLGIADGRKTTTLDSSYYIRENAGPAYASIYAQKFSSLAMAGKLDAVVADEEYFTLYSSQGFFQELTSVLTEPQLERYRDSLMYLDLPGDEVEGAVPIGIDVTRAARIVETASYPGATAYFGLVSGTERTDTALAFLEWLEGGA